MPGRQDDVSDVDGNETPKFASVSTRTDDSDIGKGNMVSTPATYCKIIILVFS